jgi:hypothetical protein
MRIGAHLRHAAPDHPAGAEWSITDAFTWLETRKHHTRILAEQAPRPPTQDNLAEHYQTSDIMLTQLDAIPNAMLLASTYQTPLVHYIHSPNQLDRLGVMPDCAALIAYNTQHVADATRDWPGPSIVLRPPINTDRVRVTPGACTTLINLSAQKGGNRFYRLKERMDEIPFLGVQGAYDHQVLAPDGLALGPFENSSTGLPPNMQVLPPQPDIRAALGYTRVLLVLSASETYGRVAAEAAVSGIPTIAYPTPGLREALGDAAVWVDPDDSAGLERAVRAAYTPAWDEWSANALAQADANHARQERELRAFERALRRIKREQPVMTL